MLFLLVYFAAKIEKFCECHTITTERIIGGFPVDNFSHPYHAAIFFVDHFRCGASMINFLYALTAAHCFDVRNLVHD